MTEFLAAYGSWIVLGLFLVLMLRMHAGGGCGASHGHQHTAPEGSGEGGASSDRPGAAPAARSAPTGGRCH